MSDDADRAQDALDKEMERAMVSHAAAHGETANECDECGYLIPSAHQVALPGVRHCVECAEMLEHWAKRFSR